MENENLNNLEEQANNGDTPNTEVSGVETTTQEETNDGGSVEEQTNNPQPKLFTQEQVNDFVRKRLERNYTRYGCKNSKELDDLVGKAQSYEVMKDRYGDLQIEHANLLKDYSFLKNNVNPDRVEDINAYFKGKGIDFSNDALVEHLATHPEWLNQVVEQTPTTTISVMGSERNTPKPMSEKDIASKMFGMKL